MGAQFWVYCDDCYGSRASAERLWVVVLCYLIWNEQRSFCVSARKPSQSRRFLGRGRRASAYKQTNSNRLGALLPSHAVILKDGILDLQSSKSFAPSCLQGRTSCGVWWQFTIVLIETCCMQTHHHYRVKGSISKARPAIWFMTTVQRSRLYMKFAVEMHPGTFASFILEALVSKYPTQRLQLVS